MMDIQFADELAVLEHDVELSPDSGPRLKEEHEGELALWWEGLELFPGLAFSADNYLGSSDLLRNATIIPFALELGGLRGASECADGLKRSSIFCVLLENPLEDFYFAFPVHAAAIPQFEGNRWLEEEPEAQLWIAQLLKNEKFLRLVETADMSKVERLDLAELEDGSFSASTIPAPDDLDKTTLILSLPDEILELEEDLLPSFSVVSPLASSSSSEFISLDEEMKDAFGLTYLDLSTEVVNSLNNAGDA